VTTPDEERQALAHEFDLTMHTGAALSLGWWAGRGDYSNFSTESREKAGTRAFSQIAELISELVAFQHKLAPHVTLPPGWAWTQDSHLIKTVRLRADEDGEGQPE
jgi:hypothetical protein